MRQTWLYRCLGMLALFTGGVALPAAEPTPRPRALLKAGGVVSGRLLGTSAAKISFAPADGSEHIPVAALSEVVFDAGLRRASTTLPLRRLAFQGGEQWHADVLLEHDGSLQILRAHERPASIPVAAVAGVYAPAGELLAVYEDFESEPVAFTADAGGKGVGLDESRHRSGRRSLPVTPRVAACTLPVVEPVGAGRVELSFFDDGRVVEGLTLHIELEFRGADGAFVVQIAPGWKKHYECGLPSRASSPLVLPLPRSDGWHDLTIDFDEHRLVALVDDQLLARAAGMPAGLEKLRISASENPDVAAAAPATGDASLPQFSIDDVKITRYVEPLREPESTTRQGAVWLAEGDEVFGDVLQFDAHKVLQHGAFGPREWPWKALRGVIFSSRAAPQAPPVAGLVATIDLAPLLYSTHEEPDRLVAAIESIDEREAVLSHPWLGKLHVPAAHLSRIVPQFEGTLYIVDPGQHHLGNAVREDMNKKLPDATRWERQIVFDKAPAGKAWLSLLAADLEAAAPLAPHDAPFRKALQAGFLSTELYVNGRRIDSLNRYVALKAAPSNPQRLRIPLPAGALRAGANTLRFEQRPARDDPQEFDDFEFSRVALEIEP